MKVVRGVAAYEAVGRPLSLAHGNFDGVHLGHQAVIAAAIGAARQEGGQAGALTFDPHPQHVIAPQRRLRLLTTIEERLDLFRRTGLDTAIVADFDASVRALRAAEWLAFLRRHIELRRIVVSSAHTFGRDREGTAKALDAWGRDKGVDVVVVPAVSGSGGPISSSAIRTYIEDGDLGAGAGALGRWYEVTGVVAPGDRRGRELGFPTANVSVPAEKLIPPTGVYAAYARVDDGTHMAAVNIGVRPTFGPGPLLVEAHLLDVDEDLYGRPLTLAFVRRLRDELRFTSADALIAQMHADVRQAREILTGEGAFGRVS